MDNKFTVFIALIKWHYAVQIVQGQLSKLESNEMHNWCTAAFGKEAYTASFNQFYFLTEQQRTMFLLRWS